MGLYQGLSNIDNVNLFNGGLALTIPLGPDFPHAEGRSFGLSLQYNSMVWEHASVDLGDGTTVSRIRPYRYFNAGLGWSVSLGRLILPCTQQVPSDDFTALMYLSPDGAEHKFYASLHPEDTPQGTHTGCSAAGYFYTRDGSYLRLKLDAGMRQVHYPDGIIHEFDSQGRLTRITGPFGDDVSVSYALADRWTLTLRHGRTITVFLRSASTFGPNSTVDRVVVPAFGGGTATYQLSYEERQITVGCPHNDPNAVSFVTVPFLKSIGLPDGSKYDLPLTAGAESYNLTPGGPGILCDDNSGLLRKITLPTLGRLEYDYDLYVFPGDGDRCQDPGFFNSNVGVGKRRMVDGAGGVVGVWTYDQSLDVNITCGPTGSNNTREAKVTVTDPVGNRTENFFSVSVFLAAGGWTPAEYGMPMTRNANDGAGRFLSTRTFNTAGTLVRSTYVRYQQDTYAVLETDNEANRRLESQRIVYNDDSGRFADTTYSDFDGLGHYRTTTTGGNFSAGNVRTKISRYNLGRTYPGSFAVWPATSPWLINTASEEVTKEGSQSATTQTCYDTAAGALRWRRRLVTDSTSSTVQSPFDVLEVFGVDGAGNVTTVTFYGADPGGLPATPANATCSLPALPSSQYQLVNSFSAGVQASSKYDTMTHKNVDYTIDPSTGLVSRSRGSDGVLETVHLYDAMGRRTWERPAHDSWTKYTHTNAVVGTPAAVLVEQLPNGGVGAPLSQAKFVFDDFGRHWRTRRFLQGAWTAEDKVFNALGWTTVTKEERLNAEPVSRTDYLNFDAFGRPGRLRPADGFAHDVVLAYKGRREVKRTVSIGSSRDAVTGNILETPATTTEEFDRQGRLYRVTEPNGTLTTFSYDVGDRVSQVTMSAGATSQTRLYDYDRLGFLRSERHPEKGAGGNGFVQYFSYDAMGNAGRVVDGPSDLDYSFDRAGRVTTITERGSGRLYKSFVYATTNSGTNYRKGQLEVADRYNYLNLEGTPYTVLIRELYQYQGNEGRTSYRETSMQINGALTDVFGQGWTYGAGGEVLTTKYPKRCFGPCADPYRTVTSTYTDGFLTSVSDFITGITYHSHGLPAQITHANGVVETWEKDPAGMQRPYRVSTSGATPTWNGGYLAYDGAGNVVKQGHAWATYDNLVRIKEGHVFLGVGGVGTEVFQTYSYDAFGNLVSIGGTSGRSIPTSSTTNRLAGVVTHDNAGNLTSWNGNLYEFDPFHQISHALIGGEHWYYIYSADDERLLSYPLDGDETNRWTLRDLDGKVLSELEWNRITTVWTTTRNYAYRGRTPVGADVPAGRQHFHSDLLGTPRQITWGVLRPAGTTLGQQAAYHVYYPFGEEATPFNQDEERLKLAGQERDLNSPLSASDDLDYLHARFLSPVTSRFLSPDPQRMPEGNPQGLNLYSYGLNNPWRYTDPNGRDEQEAIDDTAAMVTATAALAQAAGANPPVVTAAVVGGGSYLLVRQIDETVTKHTGDDLLTEKALISAMLPGGTLLAGPVIESYRAERADYTDVKEGVEAHQGAVRLQSKVERLDYKIAQLNVDISKEKDPEKKKELEAKRDQMLVNRAIAAEVAEKLEEQAQSLLPDGNPLKKKKKK